MEFRHLGRSGLLISEISYGNWLTHGSQVEQDAAIACVHAALDAGITTFDTADVYAGTKAESVLGEALNGVRRESYELFTKVYWPTGPGKNDRGLSRKHIMESIDASLRRLQTDHLDLYQAHRYDFATPLEETMSAFADIVHSGRAHYIGVSEWTAGQIREAHKLAQELRIPLVSSQPQYSMLWRVIEAEVVPTCRDLGLSQIVFSPVAQGVLTGKYKPGVAPPAGSRATDDKGGANMISRWMRATTSLHGWKNSNRSRPKQVCPWHNSRSPGCCRMKTSPPPSLARAAPNRSPTTSRPPASPWTTTSSRPSTRPSATWSRATRPSTPPPKPAPDPSATPPIADFLWP